MDAGRIGCQCRIASDGRIWVYRDMWDDADNTRRGVHVIWIRESSARFDFKDTACACLVCDSSADRINS